MKATSSLLFLLLLALGVTTSACDTSISGSAHENQPPETDLSVRDTSLVDNLDEDNRLASTVQVSWSGTDPDGFVTGYDLRYYLPGEQPEADQGWSFTTSNDSLLLLPIPPGASTSNVIVEVRAIDDAGDKDPTPARTVFPIRNQPPTARLSTFDAPPDTTFTVATFAWEADDPEGVESLSRIEISLNDSTRFVALPADTRFITLVGEIDQDAPAQETVPARVYTGESFTPTDITVPGLALDADNVFYLRAVDQTDTTSTLVRYPSAEPTLDERWFVKRPQSRVLLVNDYRVSESTSQTVQAFHKQLLREYLPAGEEPDVWNLGAPYGSTERSEALPPNADPTLRQALPTWDYIYWVSSRVTNAVQGNNLPLAAGVMDLFFSDGGRLMVVTPISSLDNPDFDEENPATSMLPMEAPVALPDSFGTGRLELSRGARVDAVSEVPDLGVTLPPLVSTASRLFIEEYPYTVAENAVPLYEGSYRYRTSQGRGDWDGPSTLASMTSDGRIGLLAVPFLDAGTGDMYFETPSDEATPPQCTGVDPVAARCALKLMLQGLSFPR